MYPKHLIDQNTVEFFIALFSVKNKLKEFYDGRSPTYSDINLFMSLLKHVKMS